MEPFEFVRATDIQDVLVAIRRPGSRILAGGTSLVDLMKLGVETPSTVVDINALPLSMISDEGDALTIGALASNSDVAVIVPSSSTRPPLDRLCYLVLLVRSETRRLWVETCYNVRAAPIFGPEIGPAISANLDLAVRQLKGLMLVMLSLASADLA